MQTFGKYQYSVTDVRHLATELLIDRPDWVPHFRVVVISDRVRFCCKHCHTQLLPGQKPNSVLFKHYSRCNSRKAKGEAAQSLALEARLREVAARRQLFVEIDRETEILSDRAMELEAVLIAAAVPVPAESDAYTRMFDPTHLPDPLDDDVYPFDLSYAWMSRMHRRDVDRRNDNRRKAIWHYASHNPEALEPGRLARLAALLERQQSAAELAAQEVQEARMQQEEEVGEEEEREGKEEDCRSVGEDQLDPELVGYACGYSSGSWETCDGADCQVEEPDQDDDLEDDDLHMEWGGHEGESEGNEFQGWSEEEIAEYQREIDRLHEESELGKQSSRGGSDEGIWSDDGSTTSLDEDEYDSLSDEVEDLPPVRRMNVRW